MVLVNQGIDFVIPWVDGNDFKWQNDKNFYSNKNTDNRNMRFRDWDNLQYWFRGVEKNASWVRKIHFVTYGHIPDWLNIEHPKLNIVNHSDYMPAEYLPTFNSNPIELNYHRINGLAENFVSFNDDFFIIKPLKKDDFFKGEIPRDVAGLECSCADDIFSYTLFNNFKIINNNFNKKKVIKSNLTKWFNPKYNKIVFKTLLLYPWDKFPGIVNTHLPIAYKKSTFNKLWDIIGEELDTTSQHKFRSKDDITHWIFRYWRIMEGDFAPGKVLGKYYGISSEFDAETIGQDIRKQKNKIVCINDCIENDDFESAKRIIKESFEILFPEKSNFEL